MEMSSKFFAKIAFSRPARENTMAVRITTDTVTSGRATLSSVKNDATTVTRAATASPRTTPPTMYPVMIVVKDSGETSISSR